jgi:L-asparaginase II
MASNNPLTVEVTRGDMVESRHQGVCVVMDAGGKTARAWGDGDRVVFPRSAVKPLQALALVETGAAEAFDVTDAELALACASHSGMPEHTDICARWLERLGLGPGDLRCGAHRPLDPGAAKALIRSGEAPGPLHNTCSGKHAGMLTTAKHLDEPVSGYAEHGHPVQVGVARILGDMGGQDLTQAPRGQDGCGIPVLGMPLAAMARALALMADPKGLDEGRAEACRRIVGAMTAHPFLVAGPGRFDNVVMEAAKAKFAVKAGAEGVYGAILPGPGLGVALKIDDGAKRAAEVAMAAVLDHLGVLDAAAVKGLEKYLDAPVMNSPGIRVGSIRMEDGWAD